MKTWKTQDGRKIKIEDLGDDHLRNIIKKSFRDKKELPHSIKDEYCRRNLKPSFEELQKMVGTTPIVLELLKRIDVLEKRVQTLEIYREL